LELRNNFGIDCGDFLTLANHVGEEALTNYLLGYREDIKPQNYETDFFLYENLEKQDPELVYNVYTLNPETLMSEPNPTNSESKIPEEESKSRSGKNNLKLTTTGETCLDDHFWTKNFETIKTEFNRRTAEVKDANTKTMGRMFEDFGSKGLSPSRLGKVYDQTNYYETFDSNLKKTQESWKQLLGHGPKYQMQGHIPALRNTNIIKTSKKLIKNYFNKQEQTYYFLRGAGKNSPSTAQQTLSRNKSFDHLQKETSGKNLADSTLDSKFDSKFDENNQTLPNLETQHQEMKIINYIQKAGNSKKLKTNNSQNKTLHRSSLLERKKTFMTGGQCYQLKLTEELKGLFDPSYQHSLKQKLKAQKYLAGDLGRGEMETFDNSGMRPRAPLNSIYSKDYQTVGGLKDSIVRYADETQFMCHQIETLKEKNLSHYEANKKFNRVEGKEKQPIVEKEEVEVGQLKDTGAGGFFLTADADQPNTTNEPKAPRPKVDVNHKNQSGVHVKNIEIPENLDRSVLKHRKTASLGVLDKSFLPKVTNATAVLPMDDPNTQYKELQRDRRDFFEQRKLGLARHAKLKSHVTLKSNKPCNKNMDLAYENLMNKKSSLYSNPLLSKNLSFGNRPNEIDSSHPETKINCSYRPDITKLSPKKEVSLSPNKF
jgi:hypothetical protein